MAHIAGRILVQGGGLWQLFGHNGKPLADGRYGSSSVILDGAHSLLYTMDLNNFLVAHSLSDGGRVFRTSPAFGDTFARPLLARQGNRLLIVGIEGAAFPHRPTEPNLSVIEFKDLDDKLKVGETGLLLSVKTVGKLLIHTVRLRVAVHDDTVVFAVPGCIYLASTDLTLRRAFQADFEPQMMSLDEAGRIYLIVNAGGKPWLWIISPEGKRLAALALKPQQQPLIAPPIVGYNHQIYLVTPALITAISLQGESLWERPSRGRLVGAGVTSDDHILIGAGSEIAAFDANGDRRVLYSFSADPPATAPVLTAGGEILVASRHVLYCLSQ